MADNPRILDPTGQVVSGNATELRGQRIQLKSQFSLQNGQSVVVMRIPGTDMAYTMLPAEARLLGMQMICEAERAMADAVTMRIGLELLQLAPAEAAELTRTMGGGTRADHAATYERMILATRKEQQEQALKPEESDGQTPTH